MSTGGLAFFCMWALEESSRAVASSGAGAWGEGDEAESGAIFIQGTLVGFTRIGCTGNERHTANGLTGRGTVQSGASTAAARDFRERAPLQQDDGTFMLRVQNAENGGCELTTAPESKQDSPGGRHQY
ncbi:hypothetical protein CC80DRAFT_548515 [Byssothecium circinans]|uniref:Uncharacterized protein n=1 Tax=Byssothecium circinans TaxID=147558 RepID=A0A6A5TUW2_9PLEO|nr:hypothetical protein CC80DRAFT_548515 [Byssothecium circinans]